MFPSFCVDVCCHEQIFGNKILFKLNRKSREYCFDSHKHSHFLLQQLHDHVRINDKSTQLLKTFDLENRQ